MRMAFQDLFSVHEDGSVSPRVQVHINGVTMGPGVRFGSGVSFGGVDLTTLQGKDLDVEVEGGLHVIKGYFN